MSDPDDADSGQSDWQRLSLISIAYFTIKFTFLFVRNAFQSIIPAIAAISVFADNKALWFSIALPAVFLAIAAYSSLYYVYFRFKTHEGEILIQRGVLQKEHLNLKFSRIQNVNIIRPFYFAPFKVVNCIVESAGSQATEIELPGVDEKFALDTQSKVFEAEGEDENREAKTEESSEHPSNCHTISNWEVAKSGLTSYFAFVALAALSPFSERIGRLLFESAYSSLLAPFQSVPFLYALVLTVLIFVSIFLVLIALVTASVVGSLIRYFKYELHDMEDRLVQLTGFFERKSTTLKKSKVQSIVITQNLAAGLLGRLRLQYRQVGASNDAKSDSHIQVPILKPDKVETFASIVFPDCPQPKFTQIHPSYKTRVFLFFCFIPLALIVSILSILISKVFLFGLTLLLPGFLLIRLRYQRYGYWSNEEYAAVREGLIGEKITVFPLRKMQTTRIVQSRGQRIRKLGNLSIQLGSGTVTIPYLPMDTLNEIVDQSLYKVESSTEPWM